MSTRDKIILAEARNKADKGRMAAEAGCPQLARGFYTQAADRYRDIRWFPCADACVRLANGQ